MDAQAIINELRRRGSNMVALDTPQDQDLADIALDIGAGFLPVVGTAQAGRDFERARRENDILGMGLSGLGMIPVVGGVTRGINKMRKGAKAVDATADALRKFKYPQGAALETARKNAVEMLGLPPNNTAMDRAKAMGFDTDVFHGQSKTPERRIYEDGVYLGTDEPVFKEMTHFTPNGGRGEGGALFASDFPMVASGYATPNKAQAGAVYPLKVRSSDFAQFGVPDDAGFAAIERFNRGLDRGKNRYFRDAVMDAKEQGKRGAVIRNVEDSAVDIGIVPTSNVYAVSSAPVRSRFAAFDPARINENDLLGFIDPKLAAMVAAGGAGAATVAALRKKNEDKEEK